MKFSKTKLVLATAMLLALTANVQAKVPALDKVNLSLGIAIPDNSTTISFDNNSDIDFEKDVGLESDELVGQFGFTWRPWENHQFGLTYFNNSAENTKQVTGVEWNDVVYNGTVKLENEMDSYDISYIWWWKNEENWAFGPRIGLTWMNFDAEIDLLIDDNGDPVVDDSFNRSGSTDIPAPTIGAAWRWSFADNWRLKLDAGYMSAEIGDFDGDALILGGGVEWFPWENWGFSLNFMTLGIDVNTVENDFNGDLDVTMNNYNFGIMYRF
jgi:hypothetical protein